MNVACQNNLLITVLFSFFSLTFSLFLTYVALLMHWEDFMTSITEMTGGQTHPVSVLTGNLKSLTGSPRKAGRMPLTATG